MKTANPFYKVFTADLIPDDGEVGNAFWGYHVGNNFSRLMGVEGTCLFAARNGSLSTNPITGEPNLPLIGEAFQDIPVANLQFNAVPLVQFSVRKQIDLATVVVVSHESGLTLLHELTHDEREFQAYSGQLDFTYDPALFNTFHPAGIDIKIGTNDEEILLVRPTNFGRYDLNGLLGYYYRFQVLDRSRLSTPIGEHSINEGIRIVDSANPTITHEDHYFVNPGYVEGYMDQEKLRVRWLSEDAGTVIYKIFGA